MNRKEKHIIDSLIEAGLIGIGLGKLLHSEKELGALASSAIIASIEAGEKAKKTDIPIIIEDNNALYKVYPDGTKEFIKTITKNTISLPKKFVLK